MLDRTLSLAYSDDAFIRARAADDLGELGIPERTFPDQCFDAVLPLLHDNGQQVVFATIAALQHIDRSRAAPFVIPFARHHDDNIRYAVAVALGDIETPEAVDTLAALMQDGTEDVRNWATFSLGQLSDVDFEEVRAALTLQLTDNDPGVRYEAVIGLARRRDSRALGFLKTILHAEPDDVVAREAAATLLGLNDSGETATEELLGALQRLQRWGRHSMVHRN